MSDLAKIFELIAQMNKNPDKLEHIEQHLTRVDEDIRDLKQSYTFVHNTTDELAKQGKVNSDALKDLSDKKHKTQNGNKTWLTLGHAPCGVICSFTTYQKVNKKIHLPSFEKF